MAETRVKVRQSAAGHCLRQTRRFSVVTKATTSQRTPSTIAPPADRSRLKDPARIGASLSTSAPVQVCACCTQIAVQHETERLCITPSLSPLRTPRPTASLLYGASPLARLALHSNTDVMWHVQDRGGDRALAKYMSLPVNKFALLDPSLIHPGKGNRFLLQVPRINVCPRVSVSQVSLQPAALLANTPFYQQRAALVTEPGGA